MLNVICPFSNILTLGILAVVVIGSAISYHIVVGFSKSHFLNPARSTVDNLDLFILI